MKILLLGKNGQVGWELLRSLAPLGDVIALDRHDTEFCGDLENLEGIANTVQRLKPAVIVNAAAYTAVDKAESDRERAKLINAAAPGVLAREAKKIDALLVHYSTDYVFNGQGDTFWKETDSVAPLNAYGKTKLEGEQAILASGCRHLILRTCWVYAVRGNNFAKTMLRLARQREALSVVSDQFGAPTGAELIADVTAQIIVQTRQDASKAGLYHLAAAGVTSWFDYAQFIFACARKRGLSLALAENGVTPVPGSSYPTPAKRPSNSRISTHHLENTFQLKMPAWQSGVERMLTELLETSL
jgi:dTDP-4-dehydrorhamnose reductase